MTSPRIYLESTIPSYLVARPSKDAVLRGQQEATKRWWERERESGNWFISEFVEVEVARGDSTMARKRLDALAGLPRLLAGEHVIELAEAIFATGLFPAKARMDASHIAIASVHGMDYLLTWNCTHIHNVAHTRRIEAACALVGFSCPVICSPLELL
jgi:predicted nucleic acid-binding protein